MDGGHSHRNRRANPQAIPHQSRSSAVRHASRKRQAKPSQTARGLIASTLAPYTKQGWSPDKIAARALIAECGSLKGHEITPAHITRICARWLELAPVTRRNYHSGLRKHLRTVGAPWHLEQSIPGVKPHVPRNIVAPDEEFAAALSFARPPLRLAMLFARDAGVRIGTIVRIKPENIDTSTWTLRRRTKGGGQVQVPLTQRLRGAVDAALKLAQPNQTLLEALGLWAEDDPYRSMMRALQKAKKQADCRLPWTFHDLRRTKARELYDRSHDLRKVQALLGHRHMAYTLHYLNDPDLRITAEDLEEDIA